VHQLRQNGYNTWELARSTQGGMFEDVSNSRMVRGGSAKADQKDIVGVISMEVQILCTRALIAQLRSHHQTPATVIKQELLDEVVKYNTSPM